MRFYGALILFMTLSAAYALKCYQCVGETCTGHATCDLDLDQCSITYVDDVHKKICTTSLLCIGNDNCCATDLCNSAISTGSSVLLLLLSSAIITVFL
ncbi:lymphocyte antigen 6B-like [Cottoperca gobio]|uniref:Lymphocyte antigen 6B-like n=1 Tax=Cottoperca gobio TaxID=56716 RepID=A0A6J2QBW0_COTGO|nr:lymphocyte antigen 6B-like [Cottoperca gobio]